MPVNFLAGIGWLIDSYDAGNKQKQYKEPLYKQLTNYYQWELE